MPRLLRDVWIGLAAAVWVLVYLFPYFYLPGTWWRAIPSSCLIVALAALFWGRDAFEFLGLRLTAKQLALSTLVFLLALPVVWYVLFSLVVVEPLSVWRSFDVLSRVHQFFQVFNDEIVLRAALLTVLLRAFPHPKTVVLVTALSFAVGHHALYRLSGVEIDWLALTSLFSFGAILNCLFVRFGHIGFCLALHYAWNFYRFSGTHYYLDGGPLSEGATFNYVEGNAWVALGAFIAFIGVFGAYWSSGSLRAVSPQADQRQSKRRNRIGQG